MKNYRYISVAMVALILLSTTNCQKFLDIKPKGVDVLENINHYNGLLNNMMLLALQNYRVNEDGSTTMLDPANSHLFMSDDVFTTPANFGSSTKVEVKSYKWEADIYEESEDPSEWGSLYVPIYTYNLIVNGVMNSADGSEAKKKELQAEARANRALNYLFLVNFYGKPYNKESASTDLGVPLVTKPDAVSGNFERATVQQVYDFIIKELEESIPDLPAQTLVRIRMSKAAAWFTLGRAYFYMKEYEKAITALDNAQRSLATLPFKVGLYDYNVHMNMWYIPFMPQMGAMSYPGQFNSEETIFMKQLIMVNQIMGGRIFVKESVMSKFGSNDQRRKHFSNTDFFSGMMPLPGYQRCSPMGTNFGPNLPDLYLMRAECKARLNDLSGAKEDLETLRKNRMPEADAAVTATTQDDMVRFVLDERVREFAGTGMRWFDMRRLADDPKYNNIENTRTYGNETLTLTKERLTLRIPAKILKFNPNMKNND